MMKETLIKVSNYRRCNLLPSCSIPCNALYKKTNTHKHCHTSKAIFHNKEKKVETAKIKNENSQNLSNLNPVWLSVCFEQMRKIIELHCERTKCKEESEPTAGGAAAAASVVTILLLFFAILRLSLPSRPPLLLGPSAN
jgi:hypothetical protein